MRLTVDHSFPKSTNSGSFNADRISVRQPVLHRRHSTDNRIKREKLEELAEKNPDSPDQTDSTNKTDSSAPNNSAPAKEWIQYLGDKFGIQPRFQRPHQETHFSGPDFYACIAANASWKQTFAPHIKEFETNNEFTPEQRNELNKLYRYGFIKPMRPKQARSLQGSLSNVLNYPNRSISTKALVAFKDAYFIAGGEKDNPCVKAITEFFQSHNGKLPKIFTEDRSTRQDREKSKSEKYTERVARGRARSMPLPLRNAPQGVVLRAGGRKVKLFQRDEEGELVKVLRTKPLVGVRERIASAINDRSNRSKLEDTELDLAATKNIGVKDRASLKWTDSEWINRFDSAGLIRRNSHRAVQDDKPTLNRDEVNNFDFKLVHNFGETVKSHDSFTQANIMEAFVTMDPSNTRPKRNPGAELKDTRGHTRWNINGWALGKGAEILNKGLLLSQRDFILAAHKLGYLIEAPAANEAKANSRVLKGGLGHNSGVQQGLFDAVRTADITLPVRKTDLAGIELADIHQPVPA